MPTKEYYRKHREEDLERSRKYYLKNKDILKPKLKEYTKSYYKNNKEKIKEQRLQNKEKIKDYKLKYIYGISLKEYKQKLETQKGKCVICNGDDKNRSLSVDHNHNTGEIRDLLCSRCNRDIMGKIEKEGPYKAIQILENTISYINKWFLNDINNNVDTL